MALDLGENLFGLCLSFLDIRDYNWMLNLPRPEVAKVLCSKWKKESRYEIVFDDPYSGMSDTEEYDEDYTATYEERVIVTHRFNGTDYFRIQNYTKRWFDKSGNIHREDGPAYIDQTNELWYKNGKHHREDGPAASRFRDGKLIVEEWWVNGERHRIGEPAVIYHDGSQEWWVNGKKHRIGGPAVISVSYQYTEWCVEGKRHRVDGPAYSNVCNGEIESWWLNGKRHRIGGPAETNSYGTHKDTTWWVNGKKHRTDGPAVINAIGSCEWWVDGIRRTK